MITYILVILYSFWIYQSVAITPSPLLTLNGTAASREFFGYSVAITDNYVIVGASAANSNAGAAYIYARGSDGSWSSSGTAVLTLKGAASDDDFGTNREEKTN